MSRSIAAISTPPAPAGLGVIRISGEDAIAIADKVFRPLAEGKTLSALDGYSALYGHVYDQEGDIDDCVALVFRAPHSYTGENVVELSCHGGVYLLRRVLRACLDNGASPAEAGEFTKRAFLNGKLDLTGADAVMDLIGAQGALAARVALATREGSVFRTLTDVKNILLQSASQMAAYVDYPYEDIPELHDDELIATLETAEEKLKKLLSTFDAGKVLREGIDTVIVGSPNVGKSTLMNRLTGCERSIVTSEAGTTRDIVEETIQLGDVTLRLADTAGIRDASNEAEAIGVQRALTRLESASLILAVFDQSTPLSEKDKEIALKAAKGNAIAILNKADCPAADVSFIKKTFARCVTVSAKSGDGIEELTRLVEEATGVAYLQGNEAVLATERQRDGAQKALASIQHCKESLQAGLTPDVLGIDIDEAIAAIAELTGERVSDAVIHEVFARFCVGK